MSELFKIAKRFGRLKRTGFKRNKFNAVKQNGYDSKMEARAGAELEVLKKGGVIKDFKRQVSVPLVVNGVTVANWKVDFQVERSDGSKCFAETKGFETADYRIKRNLFLALYPDDELFVNGKRISKKGKDSIW